MSEAGWAPLLSFVISSTPPVRKDSQIRASAVLKVHWQQWLDFTQGRQLHFVVISSLLSVVLVFLLQLPQWRVRNWGYWPALGSQWQTIATRQYTITHADSPTGLVSKDLYDPCSLDSQVKKRVVQVISAMAHHGYLELEGGELLVRFIVQHCALPDTYQVNHFLKCVNNFSPQFETNENICKYVVTFSLLDCICREARLPKTRTRWQMKLWGQCVTALFISWPPPLDD